mmetsp:Transcript_6659/g.14358  ORF Transcript_6659/g.14358 Transcript_6659/m.14358 type:complete len:90 (+) Transcript_6659:191-460(+)
MNLHEDSLTAFSKPKQNELMAFLHVRFFASSKAEKGQIPNKKGKLKTSQTKRGAEDGERNLILVSFESKSLLKVLPRPDVDTKGIPYIE